MQCQYNKYTNTANDTSFFVLFCFVLFLAMHDFAFVFKALEDDGGLALHH